MDFRLSKKTYFCSINNFVQMINIIDKKSFNEKDLLLYGNPLVIKKEKLKVNYRYNIDQFIKETVNDRLRNQTIYQ